MHRVLYVLICCKGRVGNWRSSRGSISSSPHQNRACDFLAHGFPIIFFQRLSQTCLPSGIVPLKFSNLSGVSSLNGNLLSSLLQKLDESIAPSSSRVLLLWDPIGTMGNSDSLAGQKNFVSLYPPVAVLHAPAVRSGGTFVQNVRGIGKV